MHIQAIIHAALAIHFCNGPKFRFLQTEQQAPKSTGRDIANVAQYSMICSGL